MRNLKKLFVVILLALALGEPVYAGDMPTPPNPDPDPHSVATSNQETPPPASDSQAPTAPDDFIDTTTVVFDLFYDLLSIY